MQHLRKQKIKFNIIVFFTILLFSSTVFSAGLPAGRLIPDGKVYLFKGNQKVGEYHSEVPLPHNTLLSVQGQCGIKLSDAYLVATDKSLFAINVFFVYAQLATTCCFLLPLSFTAFANTVPLLPFSYIHST